MKTKKKGYNLLLWTSIILTLTAISTLIPQATASKTCIAGYHAHCTATPVSTIVCLILAGLLCRIRSKKFTEV